MDARLTWKVREQPKLKMVIDYEAGKVHAQRAAQPMGSSQQLFRRIVATCR
jgi:hypothetical protein